MMNILDIQDKLKSLSQDQLANEMQMPSGAVPQFLVLGELNRRQSMRQSMQQQGAGAQTVAQELLNGAGVPSEGMSEMGRSMAPKSSIAQNTGIGSLPQQAPPPEQGAGIAALAPQQPMGMYGGGPVTKMAAGRTPPSGNWYDSIVDLLGGTSDEEMRQIEASRYGDARAKIHDENGKVVPDPEAEDRSWFNPAPAPQRSGPTPLSVFNRQEEQRKAAAAAAAPDGGAATTGASGSGSGSGSGPMSSYEKMLQDAMDNAEKKAKQDKWLALAQAGMALMSSTSGSFAGALGEAGKVGIEALQGSRDVAEQNKLKLGQEMFGIEQARAAQARAAAASGQRRAPTAKDLMSQLNDVQEFIDTINPTPGLGEEAKILSPAEQASVDEAMGIRDALVQAIGQMGVGAADLSDTSQ